MSEPAMAGVTVTGLRGTGGRLLALARAAAFLGLLLAGTVVLIVTVAPAAAAALGLGHLVQDGLRGSLAVDRQRGKYLAGLLGGLACGWLVLPVTLVSARRVVGRTRWLSARWCGVLDPRRGLPPAAAGDPPVPAGPGPARRPWRRLAWLLRDPATWRDLAWLAVSSVAGLVLLLVPLLLAGAAP